MGTRVHGYKGTWVHGYIFLVHWHVGCLKVCIHSDNDDDDKIFKKNFQKNFQKKIFFSSCFFFENHNKIAKNRQITKMLTVPNRQDFEVFITY